MQIPKPSEAIHKAWLYRLLSAIADDPFLSNRLVFKGGTAAAMRGFLDRFSVDLDFDLLDPLDWHEVGRHFEKTFKDLGLTVKDHSRKAPQYFLHYPAPLGARSITAPRNGQL